MFDDPEHRGLFVIACLTMILWYFAWVRPHEEALLHIAECTDGSLSRASWARCAKETRLHR